MIDAEELDVETAAQKIRQWGLAVPVSVLLPSIKPLGFLLGQLLWLGQPLVGLFADARQVAGFARLLEQPSALDSLVARLEEHQP